ncbi:hypothetical protein NS337_21505 [Pseudomonas oryzihabitans]|uniref:hypothetical protein n=1 Tax=Pseudomonas oryzihabitans TaxID=47885 RepID=UPI0007360F2F|nr:hypothetical protein [Pseudomonas psychrotolerans]KTT47804.1 hypothetical protein NS337_21505 [Pseudomonas psychrotolerans]
MGILNRLTGRGFKALDVGEVAEVVASVTSDSDSGLDKALVLIRQQKELLVKQQAQLQQQQRTISSLMGMIDVLKKKKASPAEAKPAQKETDGTMATLRKKFGL